MDQAEVEEGDDAAPAEHVVPGGRVAVDRVQAVQAAEHEPEDRLGREIALRLGPLLYLGEARPIRELGRQHARRRQLDDDRRDADERMAGVGFAQEAEDFRLGECSRGPRVADGEDAAVHRRQVWRKDDLDLAAGRPAEDLLDLRLMAVLADAVGRNALFELAIELV